MHVDGDKALDESADRLAQDFEVESAQVREQLVSAQQRWRDVSIRDFVRLLAEKRVRAQLRTRYTHRAQTAQPI
jgi:hypothetical protein